ncbi:MAG TPA: hypothetical protein DCE42_25155 [Myxococcales bacterium]|nr:hypothetical protein [Deltaproteobacteria bacterium]HAA58075.1 hypothetical protein [Myxococcales bacterium]|tara:strand:+ start:12342 stop:13229 length:888 start_codon:yes stop_codon:yes gene_type:complete
MKRPLILTEAYAQMNDSPSLRDLIHATETAKLSGFQVYSIPPDYTRCENAENALAYVPEQAEETPGLWLGFIPSAQRYTEIYEAALDKNIRLLNTPDEHLNGQVFDRAYPYIADLTPKSLVIQSVEECEMIAEELMFPVFVKGAIQSRKSKGWSFCVAESLQELRELATQLFALENRSRGKVIVRELAQLRHTRRASDFPLGREYRVFVYQGHIVGWGYYWEGDDPLRDLSKEEEQHVLALAQRAAEALPSSYISVDVGQTEALDWIVIETGDGQFSGYSEIPLLPFWNRLRELL